MTTKNKWFPRGAAPAGFYNIACEEAEGLLDYDLPERAIYGKGAHLKLALAASATCTCAEAASLNFRGVPTGETLLSYLGTLDEAALLRIFKGKAREAVARLKKRGLLTGRVPVALDWHDVMYYGEKTDPMVVGTNRKKGSNYAFEYMTASAIVGRERLILAVLPVPSKRDVSWLAAEVIAEVLSLVKAKYLALDAGYFRTEVIRFLQAAGMRYVMRMPQTGRTKKMRLWHGRRFSYTTSGHGKSIADQATFDVVVALDRAKGFKYLLATDLGYGADRLLRMFSKRWGIETGYRVSNQFLARTTSKRYVVRLFYYLLACLLYNLWVLARCAVAGVMTAIEARFCVLREVFRGLETEAESG